MMLFKNRIPMSVGFATQKLPEPFKRGKRYVEHTKDNKKSQIEILELQKVEPNQYYEFKIRDLLNDTIHNVRVYKEDIDIDNNEFTLASGETFGFSTLVEDYCEEINIGFSNPAIGSVVLVDGKRKIYIARYADGYSIMFPNGQSKGHSKNPLTWDEVAKILQQNVIGINLNDLRLAITTSSKSKEYNVKFMPSI